MTSDRQASPEELLTAAVLAAVRGDARGYFLNLAMSHALDGITRDLRAKWPGVEEPVVETAVAAAADVLFEKARSGTAVKVPAGFIWRTAHNRLLKRHRAGFVLRESFDESREDHNPLEEERGDGRARDAMRQQAIQFARSVLPSLGQTVVVQVMTLLLDCIEQGELYIDNQFIADTLGLTKETVRKATHRGFKRLQREARRHGIAFEDDLTNNGPEV